MKNWFNKCLPDLLCAKQLRRGKTLSLSSRNLQTMRKDSPCKNTSNKKYSVINAKRKTYTKKRGKRIEKLRIMMNVS